MVFFVVWGTPLMVVTVTMRLKRLPIWWGLLRCSPMGRWSRRQRGTRRFVNWHWPSIWVSDFGDYWCRLRGLGDVICACHGPRGLDALSVIVTVHEERIYYLGLRRSHYHCGYVRASVFFFPHWPLQWCSPDTKDRPHQNVHPANHFPHWLYHRITDNHLSREAERNFTVANAAELSV